MGRPASAFVIPCVWSLFFSSTITESNWLAAIGSRLMCKLVKMQIRFAAFWMSFCFYFIWRICDLFRTTQQLFNLKFCFNRCELKIFFRCLIGMRINRIIVVSERFNCADCRIVLFTFGFWEDSRLMIVIMSLSLV